MRPVQHKKQPKSGKRFKHTAQVIKQKKGRNLN